MADPTASEERRAPSVGLLVVIGVVVFVLALARWATTDFADWVPLDQPDPPPAGLVADDLEASAHFVCSAPLETDASVSPTDQATAAMEHQTLTRTPCTATRAERRVLTVVDLVVVLAGAGAFFVVRRRAGSPAVAATA